MYPDPLTYLDGRRLRNAIRRTDALEYALYTRQPNGPPERLPESGWISSGVLDLAMLVRRAAAPDSRVEALANEFETGVARAANEFTRTHPRGSPLGTVMSSILGQEDDADGQTRRMAMTVITTALVFHESLAQANFEVEGPDGKVAGILPPAFFRENGIFAPDDLCDEWDRILTVNYWPIFWSARQMLSQMAASTGNMVLQLLWPTARYLVTGGVTQSHDLTGIVFQKLIADRKVPGHLLHPTRGRRPSRRAGLTCRPPAIGGRLGRQ